MQAFIQLTGAKATDELADLHAWLSLEDELRGRVTLRQPEAQPGDMGGMAETLMVVIGAQGAGTVLATSIATWIKHRRPSADITITDGNGRSTRLALRDVPPETLDTVVRRAVEE